MDNLAPSFTVTADVARREVHFAASGFWSMSNLADFTRELIDASKPLFDGGKMRVFGDLTGFVTQSREVAEGIRVVMQESAKLGMERTAILSDSPLAAMQYKRVNEGISTEVFQDRAEALAWMRGARAGTA